MKQFHQFTVAADEDEDIPVPHIRPHLLLDTPDQRIDSLAHVSAARTQMVAHRIVEKEHGSHTFGQHFHQHLLAATTEMRFYTIGKRHCHPWKLNARH